MRAGTGCRVCVHGTCWRPWTPRPAGSTTGAFACHPHSSSTCCKPQASTPQSTSPKSRPADVPVVVLVVESGLLEDLLDRAAHGPPWEGGPPPTRHPSHHHHGPSQPPQPKTYTASPPSDLSAAELWRACRVNSLAMLAHLASVLPARAPAPPLRPASRLLLSQLPASLQLQDQHSDSWVKLEAAPATNQLYYQLKHPVVGLGPEEEGGHWPSTAGPRPMFLIDRVKDVFASSLLRGGHGVRHVAADGLGAVARRLGSCDWSGSSGGGSRSRTVHHDLQVGTRQSAPELPPTVSSWAATLCLP